MSYADAKGWITDTCTTCGQFDYVIEDEVSDERYCVEHAGPLSAIPRGDGSEGCDSSHPKAWSDCKVNAYTIAVRVSGHLDVPVDSRWHETERAA